MQSHSGIQPQIARAIAAHSSALKHSRHKARGSFDGIPKSCTKPFEKPSGYSRSVSTHTRQESERPRLLVLDLLESYARERDIHVLLERRSEEDEWVCVLTWNGAESRFVGETARQAIMEALRQEGVYEPE